ncbi:MAG: glycoside hydrolase family 27 protein [Faecalibacterium sp.]
MQNCNNVAQDGPSVMQPATAWEDEVINDETLEQRIVYSENWQYYNAYPGDQAIADVRKNQVLYNTDAHGTKCSGETATLAFHGKNLRVFVLADSYGGDATITIDGGDAIPVSFYRPRLEAAQSIGERLASFADNATDKNTNNSKAYHLLYETYDLADTAHTMVLRTGDAPTEDATVCRAVLDFIDCSERPVFNRFNFAPYYITEITQDSALATQRIMAVGKYPITQAGFVSSATGVPTIADIVTYATPAADGTLCETITGLAPYTRYSTRAFAVANGMVYYGHETTNFRTEGSVTLSHELYGGFPEEEFALSVINQKKQVNWVCETLVHPTAKVALAPEEIVSITPTEHGVLVGLLQEGNVLVKAIDADTGALCAACDVTVARSEKSPLAKTPPMGWNSWNCFLRKVNVNNITETLETMAKPITKDGKSLKDLGYATCVIDGGWRENFLDETGAMIPSVLMGGKDGVRRMAKKAAEMGIELGLHISPGDRDCMSQPIGAKWNEATHYEQFRDWGLTFLKIDQCDYRPYQYSDMFDYARWMYLRHKYFMDNSGGETVYSISNYHFDGWQHQAAHMWRISGDIATSENTANPCGARWNTPGQFSSIYECANLSNRSADFAGQGAWNDAEMCVVGDPGINDVEGASQFNLWCVMASPLMLGNDLRTMSERTIEIITNEEVIAINQDTLGVQGRRIWKKTLDGEAVFETAPALELWAKPLADGSFAALLLNNTDAPVDGISFDFTALCITNEVSDNIYVIKGKKFAVRNLNTHADLGDFTTCYTSQALAPHESVLLKVTPIR